MVVNYKKRLLKLADHLEHGKLGHRRFDFLIVNDVSGFEERGCIRGCGTAGCAIGELPVLFRRQWKFNAMCNVQLRDTSNKFLEDDVAEFFNLEAEAIHHLFFPARQDTVKYGGDFLGSDATREQVASNIRAFAALVNNDNCMKDG